MAEVIATEIIKVVFEKLADKAIKEFARSQGIRSELKNLEKTLNKVQKLLVDASEKENGDKDVKEWLNTLQHLAYDTDDILDGLATDAMHRELNEESREKGISVRKFIPTCCTNFSLSNQFGHKLDRIATDLQDLEKKKDALGLNVKDEKPKTTSRRNETCLPDEYDILGRDGDKKKLMHQLLGNEACDKNFSIVPIVGLGGVGKTTLARVLYNEKQVKDHFELMVWVCVSDDFDIFKISKTIFQAVTSENKEFPDLNQLQMGLTEKFREKRFLLVLDDVWSEDDDEWRNLVKPFHSGAPRSKIIITTRKDILLKKLGFGHLDKLESLSPEDALSLFAYHAVGVPNFDSHPTFKSQGERIVKKCGCLPLALKALGGLLSTKTDVEDWDEVLNSEIWGLEEDRIIPALRLSYHDLPANLKQLFAYCCLFPKDFMFDREDLVLLWMAEGFLNQSIANKPPERLGDEYFEMLLSRSFFQHAPNDKSLYMMHDLMNDLAIFVAGDYFLRFDNQMEIQNKDIPRYRHMSFTREEYVSYQKFEALKKETSLRTFLAVSVGEESWRRFYLSFKILVDLLSELPLLRVLCLSRFRIRELPESIGCLKHLRYLNLSQTEIGELPENVSNLYNLQTLILSGCKNLSKLPNSFFKLKKLRHFDIRDTPHLKKIPLGICELKNLQTLTKIIIGGDDGFSITELKKLEDLHGKMSLEGLEKVKDVDANLSLKSITELELKWIDVFDGSRIEASEKKVLGELKPHGGKLKKLSIMSYGGAEFPYWVGNPLFRKLVHVSINDCMNCTSLPSLGQLPSLKELYVKNMKEVKVVGSDLLTSVAFPSLEILHFEDMKGWKEWSTKSGVVFPRLKELFINGCPNLVKVSFKSIPSLRVLRIRECGYDVLRSLVCEDSAITELEIGKISGLTNETWKDIMMNLGAVEELDILECEEIRYLWESEAEASKFLVNLRQLKVMLCSKMVSLGEKEEEEVGSNLQLTSLRVLYCESMKHCICGNSIQSLYIWSCWSMTDVICGNSIQTLNISGCESMTDVICGNSIQSLELIHCRLLKSVSFPTTAPGGGKQNLKSLYIYKCEKLTLIGDLGGEQIINNNNNNNNIISSSSSRSLAKLEYVTIHYWDNLKSINELSYSIHLTQLKISGCKSLESLPDREFVNLTSLKHLLISDCPNMDISFPRGNWPPNLSTLDIGGLKKPISEWGNQNFPPSLVHLTLYGKGEDNISQFSQDLLPTSLTELRIFEFEKLETLSKGLQHLTSLQHLFIWECPKIKDVPETLLPSLLSLTIYGCPEDLYEKTDGKGSHYWPLIQHIPKIKIED